MTKSMYGLIVGALLGASNAQAYLTKSITEQKKNQLEKDLLILQQKLKVIRLELTRITVAAAELKPAIEEDALKTIKEDISNKIDEIALQFDPNRPEPHVLKFLLEYLSLGTYQRPTGSLTPEAFLALDSWITDLSDRELYCAFVLVNEKIADQKEGTQLKALIIIKNQIRFALNKRKED